jgi:hypothetical protein
VTSRLLEVLGKIKQNAPVDSRVWGEILALQERRGRLILTMERCKAERGTAISIEAFAAFCCSLAASIREQFRRLISMTVNGEDQRLARALRESLGLITSDFMGLISKQRLPVDREETARWAN